jgi:hypothetical protein
MGGRRRRRLTVAVAILVLTPLAAAAITAHGTEQRLEFAQAASSRTR